MSDPQVMPSAGGAAPGIDEPTTQGGRLALSAHVGSWVVVYFYPRANTPG